MKSGGGCTRLECNTKGLRASRNDGQATAARSEKETREFMNAVKHFLLQALA